LAEKAGIKEVKCSKCGRTGVPIVEMRLTVEKTEYICEECAEK